MYLEINELNEILEIAKSDIENLGLPVKIISVMADSNKVNVLIDVKPLEFYNSHYKILFKATTTMNAIHYDLDRGSYKIQATVLTNYDR